MRRLLGRSGIELSAMGMGCWAIGGPFWAIEQPLGWGDVDDDESIRAVQAAFDAGVSFFDTSDVYGAGHSERVLAKALKPVRDRVVIATKFGNQFDEASKQMTGSSATPEYIRSACEASLKRLGTDVIDLYQFHLNDFPIDEAAEVRDVLEELVTEGLIRFYGWSTDSPASAAFFAQGKHCVSVQHQQNIFEDNADMLELCAAENLASINRGPLGMGLLTGKYNASSVLSPSDIRALNPEWLVYFEKGKPNAEWLGKLDSVRDILMSEGRTLAQGALAWLWARSIKTLPIPGIRTVKQAQENAAAMQKGALTQTQVQDIQTLLST